MGGEGAAGFLLHRECWDEGGSPPSGLTAVTLLLDAEPCREGTSLAPRGTLLCGLVGGRGGLFRATSLFFYGWVRGCLFMGWEHLQ